MVLTPAEREELDEKLSTIDEELSDQKKRIKEVDEGVVKRARKMSKWVEEQIAAVRRIIKKTGISVSGPELTWANISNIPDYLDTVIVSITFIIDGGGSAITTGEKGHLRIPFACEIQRVTLLADQSGSIKIDIWKDTYANFPPTNADTITGGNEPEISEAQKDEDSTLTDWTKIINAGDILAFNVDSCTSITRITIALKVKKT